MIVLTFNGGLPNDSLRVGDIIYYIKIQIKVLRVLKAEKQLIILDQEMIVVV